MSEIFELKVVFILAPENFRDEEFYEPFEILKNNGAVCKTANKDGNPSTSKFGKTQTVDMKLSDVKAANFNAIIFVGGRGSDVYYRDEEALTLAKEFNKTDRIVGAICHATGILGMAGIVTGKRVTGFESARETLERNGGVFTGTDIEVDGKIVTASGPQAATAFGNAILQLLSLHRERKVGV